MNEIENLKYASGRDASMTVPPFAHGRSPSWIVRVLACVPAMLCLCTSLSCKRGTDGRPREVVLYCSVDQGIAEPIIAQFERDSGIRALVLCNRDNGG